MLRKDKMLLESLLKKYGAKHLIKEANENVPDIKAVAQDQIAAQQNKQTKYTTEQRRKALVDFFKNKNYHDYISVLNQMAKDDKFRVLVDAAFGSDDNEALGNISLNQSRESKYTKSLIPTQSEIDITKSLVWGLKGGEKEANAEIACANIDKFFSGEAIKLGKGEGLPIVTFGSYIIDGHHRWSQVYCFNPSGKMACVDFGQMAISNQPSFHMPFLYSKLGQQEKTDFWVEKLVKEAFSPEDDGYPGDEDNGTTSAWYILATIGQYRLCPGSSEWIPCKRLVKGVKINGQIV